MTSHSLRHKKRSARAMDAGACGPCTVTFTCEMRKPNPEVVNWPRKS